MRPNISRYTFGYNPCYLSSRSSCSTFTKSFRLASSNLGIIHKSTFGIPISFTCYPITIQIIKFSIYFLELLFLLTTFSIFSIHRSTLDPSPQSTLVPSPTP